ncbi:MAG TPA: hypothetical protein VJR27_05720 [Candidatus Saccharimonadales bacterium]|nr:hypothetical protein [Candidatus Saccharimonadales bacterium]
MEIELEEVDNAEYRAKAPKHMAAAGWFELERGLALFDAAETERSLSKAVGLAGEAMDNPYGWFEASYSAAMLHIYGPMLVAQKQGTLPTAEDLAAVRQKLGIVFDALHAAPIHPSQSQHILDALEAGAPHQQCLPGKGERLGLAAKLTGMMLAARQNILLYSASAREIYGGSGFAAQSHDAYMLAGGQKMPVKIRSKNSSDAAAGGVRVARYDAGTTYINIRGTINQLHDTLRQHDPKLYRQLLQQNHNCWPSVSDVGRMLRTELTEKKNTSAASHDFLDMLGEAFEAQLFAGKEAASPEELAAVWEVLPHRIANRPYDSEQVSPEKRAIAAEAANAYLRYGNNLAEPRHLKPLIKAMRESCDPQTQVICAGAYLDLAHHPEVSRDMAQQLVAASAKLTEAFMSQDWRGLPQHEVQFLYRIGLQRAYGHKYQKVAAGEEPDFADETKLYHNLLRLGQQSLEPAAILERGRSRDDVRGMQLEIGLHLLNARRNVRAREILQSMWPSTPREMTPHDYNFDFKTNWDAAVTQGAFWDREAEVQRLQFLSLMNNNIYEPRITVVTGKEHLSTVSTAEIIQVAIQEVYGNTPSARVNATRRLNEIESRFLRRLNRLTLKDIL